MCQYFKLILYTLRGQGDDTFGNMLAMRTNTSEVDAGGSEGSRPPGVPETPVPGSKQLNK